MSETMDAMPAVGPAMRRAAAVVARATRLRVADVLAPSRWPERRARRTAVYLAVTAGGVPGRQVARVAGLHHRQVQRALAQIEDRRDDPAFDAFLSRLEGAYGANSI